jgi:hypothetical protein
MTNQLDPTVHGPDPRTWIVFGVDGDRPLLHAMCTCGDEDCGWVSTGSDPVSNNV